jgi:glycosyltransferase involved in cell wall biosynthesis
MLSFIIPAYNEEVLLGATLRAIRVAAGAIGEPFEVVVADDASTDRTANVARELGARVVAVCHRQISATRNAGARAARGEFLVFVDADTVVTEAVVRAAADAMRGGAVGGGSAFRFDGRLPLHGRVLQAIAVPLYRACRLASGCFLFCTRAAFDAVGGFDETLLVAEEGDMSLRLCRHGRFVILRQCVTTSGRKLRTYSARELLGLMARLLVSGPRGWRRREGLEAWYGERRADPEPGFALRTPTAAGLQEASVRCTPRTSPSPPTAGTIPPRRE